MQITNKFGKYQPPEQTQVSVKTSVQFYWSHSNNTQHVLWIIRRFTIRCSIGQCLQQWTGLELTPQGTEIYFKISTTQTFQVKITYNILTNTIKVKRRVRQGDLSKALHAGSGGCAQETELEVLPLTRQLYVDFKPLVCLKQA